MADVYDRLSATAQRLIKKYGYNKALYVRQIDNVDGWANEFNTEEKTVDIIVLPSQKYSKETYKINGAKDMLESNYVAYMPHSDFVPNINDIFTVNDTTHTIVNVVRINPNGKDVVYKMELK